MKAREFGELIRTKSPGGSDRNKTAGTRAGHKTNV
jgi:hypothetical protein